MPKAKKFEPKNELHHWWPRTLSRHWAAEDGFAHSLSCEGEVVRAKPKAFGAIRNDNNIYLADEPTVWDESFEHTFGPPDAKITPVMEWLSTTGSPIFSSAAPLADRLSLLIVRDEQFVALTTVLASLIIRSPCFRHRVDSGTRALRERMGFREGQGDRALLGLNIRHGQATLANAMQRGKLAILFSNGREFIFGDGFMHNIHSVANRPHSPRCLLPLTPDIAVFYASPMRYRTYPRAFAMNLTDEEIEFVNRSVQVYSKRFIFYRSQKPAVEDAFTRNEHLQWEYDTVGWTEALEATVSNAFFGSDAKFLPS